MAHSDGIITAPVSFGDVNAVLGTSHTTLSALCADPNINKFARYKSLAYPKLGLLTNAERQSVGHGITIPDVVESSTLNGDAIADAAANDWVYTRPTGGAQQPYRLHDFANTDGGTDGYYHNAVPPIQMNYPKNGWTFTRGSVAKSITIYCDLDPDDSAINLQANDFVSAGLNLNEWKLVAFVDSIYFTQKIFVCDDTILSDGEISGNSIRIDIPSGSGSYVADVYVCMYRMTDVNRYEYLPLPKQGDYNPTLMKLYIKDDASEGGGGIEGDVFANTTASYALDGTFKTLADFTDGGTAKWALRSYAGNIVFCLQLTNKSGSSRTIARNEFELVIENITSVPQYMYNANKSSISNITIANNATVTIYLEWDGILAQLSGWNNSTKNDNRSFDLTRSGAYLVGSDMYVFKGSDGWVQR